MARDALNVSSPKTATRSRLPVIISGLLSAFHHRGTTTARSGQASVAEPALDRRCIRIKDKVCEGMRIGDMRCVSELGVTVSQIQPRKTRVIQDATPETRLRQGDTILVIGRRVELDAFCERVGGQPAGVDFLKYADSVSLAQRINEIPRR